MSDFGWFKKISTVEHPDRPATQTNVYFINGESPLLRLA